MATSTTNLGLIKPAASDKIRIAQLNQNSDTLDAVIGPVGAISLQTQMNNVQDALAIIANGDTHPAITTGQFVYVKNNTHSVAEGLHVATANISANGQITTSNVSADASGGLNALNEKLQYETVTDWNDFIPTNPNVATTRYGISTNANGANAPFSGDNATFYGEAFGYPSYWTQILTVQYSATSGNRNRRYIRSALGTGSTPSGWVEINTMVEPLVAVLGSSNFTFQFYQVHKIGQVVHVSLKFTTNAAKGANISMFKLQRPTRGYEGIIPATGNDNARHAVMTVFIGSRKITVSGVELSNNEYWFTSLDGFQADETIYVTGSFVCANA